MENLFAVAKLFSEMNYLLTYQSGQLPKKAIEKKLPEITIFSWNAILGNIYFATIGENSNIYFLSKVHTFLTKVHPIQGTKIAVIAVNGNFVIRKWNHTNEHDRFMYIAKNSNV